VKLGTVIHSLLNGLLLSVVGSLLGALAGGIFSPALLVHVAIGAIGTNVSAYIVRNSPSWLTWLGQKLGGAPPPASAAGILVLLLCALPLASCAPPAAAGATLTVMAAGDTAKVFAHWPVVNRATGYTYTLTTLATNGTWTGLATGTATAATSVSLGPISTTADTAVFQLCVTATGASGASPIGCTPSAANAANTWRRKLGTPTPVMDSVTALLLLPSHLALTVGQTAPAPCPFYQLGNGAVGMRAGDSASCTSAYIATYSETQRALTPDQQALVDGRCITWHNSTPMVATLTIGSTACDGLGLWRWRATPRDDVAVALARI
jgi:hypothetical protein